MSPFIFVYRLVTKVTALSHWAKASVTEFEKLTLGLIVYSNRFYGELFSLTFRFNQS